jgi:hypothetical protein
MPRKARIEKRLVAEQNTVGQQRDERKELDELASRKKVAAAAETKALRLAQLENRADIPEDPARRTARPGKPLKR